MNKNLLFPLLFTTVIALLPGCKSPTLEDLNQGASSGSEQPDENLSAENPDQEETPGSSPQDQPAPGETQPPLSRYPRETKPYTSTERPRDLPLPEYGGAVLDPVSNTYITRIGEATDRCWKNFTGYPRHDYSKIQPWNADQTMYRYSAVAIYDAASYKPIRCLPNLYVARWSHEDPHIIYAFKPGERRILRYHTETEQVDEIMDLSSECDYMALGPGESNMDNYDERVALACRKDTSNPDVSHLVILVVNLQTGRVIARRTMPKAWGGRDETPDLFDWVGISQQGDYVVINWNASNRAGAFEENGQPHWGVEVYDSTTLTFQRRLWHHGNHGDLCVDSAGDEVYVQFHGPDGTHVNMYRLHDGKHTALISEAQNPDGDIRTDFLTHKGHISCRNIRRPGWAYVSLEYVHGDSPSETVNDGSLLAVRLDGSGTIQRFGHHQSSATNYIKSVKLVPSPDGSMVMFTSDWGNSGDEMLSYEFIASTLPPGRAGD
ncbi:MAG TPA: hypothetical protein ENJ43_01445, partial [Gammaproteobacteria bacterium]|nr:hypothetical protein [Gammaproteobacteria bacterium]